MKLFFLESAPLCRASESQGGARATAQIQNHSILQFFPLHSHGVEAITSMCNNTISPYPSARPSIINQHLGVLLYPQNFPCFINGKFVSIMSLL